uniref:uncharacterized protein LOC106995143 isoform X2 n=1 Tax=Macaca mulatta TaxID=9544 RepID=UPI0010A24524|nr:uncharacterized protein LOC106995143 isoform X2 [Macaca mulatta]
MIATLMSYKQVTQHPLIPPNQSQIQTPTDLVSLGLTWTSQMPFMVEEISQLQLSLSQRDDPAPPNSPKPKPNANPKQPGFIAQHLGAVQGPISGLISHH